ncbi:MAG: NAD(P)-dependent oxidoreductase [Desulfovibrio sp.]|nr:NAD(P)-dependent oxidoreductase [Desulfovibrio sp.]
MQTPHIVVTGGTGFIGGHLLNILVEQGYSVTCLVRHSSNTSHIPRGVRIQTVDLLTGYGLKEALAGHDILIHLAALLFGLGFRSYLSANTTCAQNLCQALADLGDCAPKKCILISSMAATGPSEGATPLSDFAKPHPVSAYGWSKLLVERTFQASYTGDLVILRPSIVYGSGDRGLLPVFQGAKYGFCVSPGLRVFPISCIHGKDMAKAIVACLTDKAHGIYHVSDGKPTTMDAFCTQMCRALHVSPHILHMPLPILTASAALATGMGILLRCLAPKRFHRAPNWNLDKLSEAKQAGWVCDSQRLHNDVGFSPAYSLEAGMVESVQGYRERGWL